MLRTDTETLLSLQKRNHQQLIRRLSAVKKWQQEAAQVLSAAHAVAQRNGSTMQGARVGAGSVRTLSEVTTTFIHTYIQLLSYLLSLLLWRADAAV
jgi:hypothetical protein